jgi:hypothetical protein
MDCMGGAQHLFALCHELRYINARQDRNFHAREVSLIQARPSKGYAAGIKAHALEGPRFSTTQFETEGHPGILSGPEFPAASRDQRKRNHALRPGLTLLAQQLRKKRFLFKKAYTIVAEEACR